jgi:hypothetical protein
LPRARDYGKLGKGAVNGEIKGWVSNEFKTLTFKSKRLERRFKMTISDLSDQPDKSIWLASGSRANAKAVYRMLSNEKVDRESILAAHRDATSSRCFENSVLLAVQDTMAVNYNGHTKTKGMGYNCEQSLGINAHNCILLTTCGVPMGLIAQDVVTREGRDSKGKTRHEKRNRPIGEKESNRWLETMKIAAQNAPPQTTLVHIADREGDIYELFALAQDLEEKFVIRAAHNRSTTEEMPSIQAVRESAPIGRTTVTIPANHKAKTKEHEALMTVQCQHVSVRKPQIRANDEDLASCLCLTMIRLAEEYPREGADPIEWILITNLEVSDAVDAMRIVGYYKQRWKIERFHFVLKSGCEIEKIQQRSVDSIAFVLLLYSIIAVNIMQLTFLSRNEPEMPCDIILSEPEWETLYCAANRTRVKPDSPPAMEEAVRLIAKLGGHVGAKSDGPPGLKVIWIGLNKLFILVAYRDFLS